MSLLQQGQLWLQLGYGAVERKQQQRLFKPIKSSGKFDLWQQTSVHTLRFQLLTWIAL